ncbi:hypothetical protein VB618_15750 [Microvirga sp. CF3062]|uniref:hypothetical protein n=1 Tax=Microvirga sp. CF3062 TaxID=3110182 RepID=UPI002E76B994|nr:hypothetical protein [Microvirga sp. CF3062]MEE1657660.1 hypothetical protein [Microvirga sp. CF3062]
MKTAAESLQAHPLSDVTATSKWHSLREIGDQSLVFISQIVLNASFFLLMLLASMWLDPSEFLKLSFANSSIPLIAAALDLGMSQSCLALSFEHKKHDYIALNLAIKGVIIAVAFAALILSLLVSGPSLEIILALAAASMSFWTATRAVEQYARRFRRYSLLNIALAATRIIFGFAAIIYGGWVALIVAIYVLAQLPIQIVTLSQSTYLRFGSINWRALHAVMRMAPITFLARILYLALPLLTLWLLNSDGNTLSAAAFSVVLMFLVPLDLLFATLKVYIFPKIVESEFKNIDLFGFGQRSMYLIMAGLSVMLAIGIVPASLVIDYLYEARFPDAGTFFMTYFSCYAVSCVIGLYTVRSQRPGFVRLSLLANILRAAATAVLMFIPALNPHQIVLWSGIIIVSGELILTALLMRAAQTDH